MTKPWHVYMRGLGTRAFVRPETTCDVVALWLRGWRRHYYGDNLWTKHIVFHRLERYSI